MEETYKFSKYNIVVEESEDTVLLYNTYSSKYSVLPRSLYEELKDEDSIDIGDFPNYLIPLGFMVSSELDEIQMMLDESRANGYRTDIFATTIAITKKCNYRCKYCFESSYLCNETMSKQVQDDTIAFIKKKCSENPTKLCSIEWFGGEPTLCFEEIKYISNEIISFCNENDITFMSSVVSNGLLLTKEFVDEMTTKYGMKKVQITLDGLNPLYAEMKGTTLDSFDKVIDNIKYAQNKVAILIRLNAEPNNVESLKELITFIYDSKLSVQVYFQNIKDLTKDSVSVYRNFKDFVRITKDLDDFIAQNNYGNIFKGRASNMRRCAYCSANADNYYVIDTQGQIYKCLDNVFNKEYVVGSIYEGITNAKMVNKFVPHTLKGECYDCGFLPWCVGKCSVEILKHPTAIDCNDYREMLRQQVQRYLKSRAF